MNKNDECVKCYSLTSAALERIASVISLTAANKAADSVGALGTLTAGTFLAFVYIC